MSLFTCYDLPSRPTHLTAKFTAIAPKNADDYVCQGEAAKTEMDIVVLWTCMRSRKRGIFSLNYSSSINRWNADFPIDCTEYYGTILFLKK